jgi:hypothetical protein
LQPYVDVLPKSEPAGESDEANVNEVGNGE